MTQFERFKLAANSRFKNKYDYSKSVYISHDKEIEIICPIHGTFFQKPENHLRTTGCQKCGEEIYKKFSLKKAADFFNHCKEQNCGKYDYSKSVYTGMTEDITIYCNQCKEYFTQNAADHYYGRQHQKCRTKATSNKLFTTEEVIKKSKLVHGDKYDYSLVEYVNARTKIKIICKEHGEFEIIPRFHFGERRQGCKKCGNISASKKRIKSEEEIYRRSIAVFGDVFEYSNYQGNKKKMHIKCKKCGFEFDRVLKSHLSSTGCPNCDAYSGEVKIGNYLMEKLIEFEKYKTFPNLRDKKPLNYDFYIPSKNLLIEYNGIQHYELTSRFHRTTKDFHKQKHHDWLKRKYAKDNKIKLLTIPYWEDYNIEKILEENIG